MSLVHAPSNRDRLGNHGSASVILMSSFEVVDFHFRTEKNLRRLKSGPQTLRRPERRSKRTLPVLKPALFLYKLVSSKSLLPSFSMTKCSFRQ